LTAVSNVTGAIFDLARVRDLIRSTSSLTTLFVVDGSQ